MNIRWIFCQVLLLLFSAGPAYAQALVDARMSGGWYDPGHNGEGFLVEILQDNQAVVYWFTYDEVGRQRWFTANGTVEDDTAVFDALLQTSGGVFGEQFNPDDVEYFDVGELSITWSDCVTADATYTVNGTQGSQQLERLTTMAGLECEELFSDLSPLSGSWFDQTHNGEGLIIEALSDGSALAYWFSYDGQGRQAWFFGLGDRDGRNMSISEMYVTSGGRFGPDFDPEEVVLAPWGSIEVALGCNAGALDYSSVIPAYGSGMQTLTRLTNPGKAGCEEPSAPNILLVIADDLGQDSSNQYDVSAQRPVTPNLDQLANAGLIFDNAWSNPTCTPTRAGILTGKYGDRTGVKEVDDVLSVDETSLQTYIREHLPGRYSDAVIGKWHLGPRPGGLDHPAEMGVSYFSGIIGGGVDDYEDWTLVTNGERSEQTEYVTSKLVDLAIDWTGAQQRPWFLWLAFNAPHTPFHLPPEDLHSRVLSGTEEDIEDNPLPYYFAAIEAMDTELGRFLDSLEPEERANTIIIFMGDNGTPGQVSQEPFGRQRAKGSLYRGGINIPFFVSGPGITRIGERESALVNTTDLFSTIAGMAGINVSQVHDSISFERLLSDTPQSGRYFQYSEQSEEIAEEWTVSEGIYKQIESNTGSVELYRLSTDPYEQSDLVEAGAAPENVVRDLQYLADQVRFGPGKTDGYTVVDSNQQDCYDDVGAEIDCPLRNEAFHGQDAQYEITPPSLVDNGDGTVTDRNTMLTWQQSPDLNEDTQIDADDKLSYSQAQTYCDGLVLGGSDDWRLPGIKQLYSLIDFNGIDPGNYEGSDTSGLVPFIDGDYFDFGYGDTGAGERVIDAQYATTTLYVSTTGNGAETMFGVNFADGRIKGYPLTRQGQDNTFYVMCVRGDEGYGLNDFLDNSDGTISDRSTGLMWAREDSLTGLNWEEALAWIDELNRDSHLGYSDWKLPNAKELQSLLDYSRSPDATNSAAIDPQFNATQIINEAGDADYAAYWANTTHLNRTDNPGASAVYVSFGRSMGYVNGAWVDIHGAGAQRSDPKAGDPDDYPFGRGPQGDAIRIYNHVRPVRSAH